MRASAGYGGGEEGEKSDNCDRVELQRGVAQVESRLGKTLPLEFRYSCKI